MSLVAVPPFPFPAWGALWGAWSTAVSYGTITLDAVSEKAAYIFQIPETGTVIGAEFRVGTVTTGCTLTVSLQTVDGTTGLPTGTLYDANATGTAVVTATTDNNKMIADGFGGGVSWGNVTVTKGALVALVIEQPGASAGSLTLIGHRVGQTPAPTQAFAFPYTAQAVNGAPPTWAKTGVNVFWPSMALEYSGSVYNFIHEIMTPWQDYSTVSWNNGSATKEYGAKITLAMPCRARGLMWSGKLLGGSDCVISLYDSGGSEVATTGTLDKDNEAQQTAGNNNSGRTSLFTATATLSAADYYVGFKPQSTTNIDLNFVTCFSAGRMTAMVGGGKIIRVERATQGSGAWTETNTSEPRIALIVDQLDNGVGGGGGLLVARGMHGGIR